jgi:antitoxin CptB
MNATVPEGMIKRLRWRCRRGTRELDVLLGRWLDAHALDADADALVAFDAMLDVPDPQLWDWLSGHATPARADWRAIVAGIRAAAGILT